MSNSVDPTFFPSNSGFSDGMDTAVSITVASGLGERRSLHDLRGDQAASSMNSSVDRKDGSLGRSLGRSSIRPYMLADSAPRQMLNARSKTSGTSILPSWDAFQTSESSRSLAEPFVRRASTDGKTSHKLQLPPFQTLGIAAPHPDNFCTRPHLSETTYPLPSYPGLEDAAGLGLHQSTDLGNKEHRPPNQVALQMLTPPDDSGILDWKPSTSATDSTKLAPDAALRAMPNQRGATIVAATHPGSSEGDQPSHSRAQQHGGEGIDSNEVPPSQTDDENSIDQSLIEQAISISGEREPLKENQSISLIREQYPVFPRLVTPGMA